MLPWLGLLILIINKTRGVKKINTYIYIYTHTHTHRKEYQQTEAKLDINCCYSHLGRKDSTISIPR